MKFIRPHLLAQIKNAVKNPLVCMDECAIAIDRRTLLHVFVGLRISKCGGGFRRLICIENPHFLLDSIYRFRRFGLYDREASLSSQPLYMIEVFDA